MTIPNIRSWLTLAHIVSLHSFPVVSSSWPHPRTKERGFCRSLSRVNLDASPWKSTAKNRQKRMRVKSTIFSLHFFPTTFCFLAELSSFIISHQNLSPTKQQPFVLFCFVRSCGTNGRVWGKELTISLLQAMSWMISVVDCRVSHPNSKKRTRLIEYLDPPIYNIHIWYIICNIYIYTLYTCLL